MAKMNKLPKFELTSLQPDEQRFMHQLIDSVNHLLGYNGPISLSNHLDLSGNKITNLGAPQSPTDAISSGHADANYSAPALRPKLEAGGAVSLRTYISQLSGDVTGKGKNAQTKVNSITGVTLDQIGGNLSLGQLPTAGKTVTITLAALTPTGTEGSITVQNGLVTGVVKPT